MRIVAIHSHLNGLEYLQVRHKPILREIKKAIDAVELNGARVATGTTRSREIERSLARGLEKTFGWTKRLGPQAGLLKDRVALEGRFSGLATRQPLFALPLADYAIDEIDVGVAVVPMKSVSSNLSRAVNCYEDELASLCGRRRGIPRVPLVLIGVM